MQIRLFLILVIVNSSISSSAYSIAQETNKSSIPENSTPKTKMNPSFIWEKTTIPYNIPQTKLIYNSAFIGIHKGAIIIAGGADPQSKTPTDRINVLTKDIHTQKWVREKVDSKLAKPLMDGTAITTSNGVICVGGTNGKDISKAVFRLRWDPAYKTVYIDKLPSLPFGIYKASGGIIGTRIYIVGGINEKNKTKQCFLSLELSDKRKDWKELQPWPGANRIYPLTIAQNDGTHNCLYLFGGYSIEGKPLLDAYKYNPKTRTWKKLTYPTGNEGKAFHLSSHDGAVSFGDSHIFVFGLEQSSILRYHTITDTWIYNGKIPKGIKHAYARKENRQIILLGFTENQKIPLSVYTADIYKRSRRFGLLNILALVVYLITLVGMGVFFSRREKSTEDFFIGGRRVPWWAAGLSIFGTQLSSISFMAVPAKVYMSDWLYYITVFCIVAVQPIIVYFYLPFFRRLNVTTAYEYLEKRFNIAARLFGSLSFILFQCGRMTIVLFLPALALSAVTGINIYVCILIMGILATFYTVLGGIEAVIWTDVLQVCVLIGGALLSLGIIMVKCGGIGQVIDIGSQAGKFRLVDLGWDWTLPVLWVVVVGNLFSNMMSYSADQAVIQRYLTTKNEKTAARAIWTNAAITIPVSTIWFLLGTALFVFYKLHPETLDPTLKNDQIFPLFIAQQLPNGITGIVIAGLFAAAMSTVDSSLNSISTAITTDFYRRFKPAESEKHYLILARVLTVVFGIVATGMGLWMAANQEAIKSLWDMYMKILGLIMGGLTGLFALGIFTNRANGVGALTGAVASAGLLWAVQTYTHVHFFLYSAIGIISCFVIGYIISLVLPISKKPIEGLTYYTIKNS